MELQRSFVKCIKNFGFLRQCCADAATGGMDIFESPR